MINSKRGELVEVDGLLGVVVGIEGDPNVPEDHVAIWFGDPKGQRVSAGGKGGNRPEIWTVPKEFCIPAQAPIYNH